MRAHPKAALAGPLFQDGDFKLQGPFFSLLCHLLTDSPIAVLGAIPTSHSGASQRITNYHLVASCRPHRGPFSLAHETTCPISRGNVQTGSSMRKRWVISIPVQISIWSYRFIWRENTPGKSYTRDHAQKRTTHTGSDQWS